MKKYTIGVLAIAALVVILFQIPKEEEPTTENIASNSEYYFNNDNEKEDSLLPEDLSTIADKKKSVPIDTNPLSITVLVNRSYLLPSTYIPSDLRKVKISFSSGADSDKTMLRNEAATSLEKLFQDAAKKGIVFHGVSGYRSYERQKQIYDNNLSSRGAKETDNVSAKPGSSEHQTGLSIDISAASVRNRLDQALGSTKEGKWLANNAHQYGYIIRYPKKKESITGYSYEPWHIRYVGKDVASYLFKNKMTLEEYYGTTCDVASGLTITGVDVENADTVKYKTPKED